MQEGKSEISTRKFRAFHILLPSFPFIPPHSSNTLHQFFSISILFSQRRTQNRVIYFLKRMKWPLIIERNTPFKLARDRSFHREIPSLLTAWIPDEHWLHVNRLPGTNPLLRVLHPSSASLLLFHQARIHPRNCCAPAY